MKLTEEQLSQLTVALGCVDGQSLQETRGRVRVPLGTRATIIPCSDKGRGEIQTIVVLNTSDTGMCIVNGVQMQAGDQFIFRVPATQQERAWAIQCSVRYCQDLTNGMWALGAQFLRILTVKPDMTIEQEVVNSSQSGCEHDLAHVREVEDRLSRLTL